MKHGFVFQDSLFFFTFAETLFEFGVLLFKVGDVGSDRLRVHV